MSVAQTLLSQDMCEYCQRFDLLDMLNDAVLLLDAQDGDILFMNQKALELYQYDKSEMKALSITILSHDAAETTKDQMAMVINQSKRGFVFTANHVRKNGTIFKVEISARHLMMHGRNVVAALIRNVTIDAKIREEVAITGKIQRRLLPGDLETVLFHMCTIYQPLQGLSGDLYDVKYDDENRVLYGFIVDVMGHGLVATGQSGILRYLFRQAVERRVPINGKLAWINNEVIPFFSSGGFAAALLFEFDFTRKILSYSSAGINQFFCLGGEEPAVIKSPGLFLGINQDETYDQSILSFQSGDSFFFMTDGLFEMIQQPLAHSHTFRSMHELCKNLAVSQAIADDASAIGILIR